MVALDGVFLIVVLVVHSGEPHRSNTLDGVAFFCSEATGDVVVVVRRCVVVGWRRRFQTLLIGMNVKNYDELCGRTARGGEGVVQRGKEHVAEVLRGRTLTWTKTSAQYKFRNLQHTDYYYVYILVFDERGHFLIKYKIELDMIFMNNIIKHDTITYYLYDYYTLILFVC
jgi:hypothetical protein